MRFGQLPSGVLVQVDDASSVDARPIPGTHTYYEALVYIAGKAADGAQSHAEGVTAADVAAHINTQLTAAIESGTVSATNVGNAVQKAVEAEVAASVILAIQVFCVSLINIYTPDSRPVRTFRQGVFRGINLEVVSKIDRSIEKNPLHYVITQLLKSNIGQVMKTFAILLILLSGWETVLAQEYATRQLEESPRHQEWVEVHDGERTIHNFVVYPEVSHNTLAVIVIHENIGLTDWVRSFADQIAAAGYIAIAPDLLSEFDEEHSGTSDFSTTGEARDALYQLDPDRVTLDLKAVQEYASSISSSNGKVVVAGFCWGGSQSFRFATNAEDLSAALVFYGSATTDEERIRNINTPVYGFYGGNDQRINATIPETEELMDRHDKAFTYKIYDGAGHGYMRTGDDPEGESENVEARNESWEWVADILESLN
ncbi:MAG: dienelactone hydrolase family protein [Balneolaceae bacterium]